MELLKLYTALLRRRWLIVQATLFFVLVGGALALVLPKNYTASARVLVSSSDTSLSILSEMGLSEVAAGLSGGTDDIQNKIALATARPVLSEVIWRLQLRDADGRLYESEELLKAGLFGELLAQPNITLSQLQGTELIIFEARADDPELARLLADTVVRVAVQTSQDRAKEDTTEARQFIEDQLTVVQLEFDAALSDIADAQASEDVIDIESEMKAAISRLSELMLAFENNAASIQDTRARLAEARAYQSSETADLISPATVGLNARVADLQGRLTNKRQERAVLLSEVTDKHPDVLALDQVIAATTADLEAALAEQHAMDPTIQQLESQLAGQIDKGAEIQASIERTTAQFGGYPDKLRRLSQLQLAATAAETVYKSLQEQSYQVGVAEAMLVSDLQLIEAAKAPERHASPRLVVNLVLGFLVGVSFGIGIAFVFEYVDDSIVGPDDLQQAWPLPRLGIIPTFKIDGDRRIIDSLELTHPISEAYRTVRNGLVFASLDKPLKRIAVSSCMPGEGKSTFSMNLAVSFAREGKHVLVCDVDLRRPTQHRAFPTTSNHIGLTDVLAGNSALDDAIQATPVAGLHVLTSGPIPTDPGRLVESLRLRQVLLDLQKKFDVVIVDTPPVLVVNDALVISRATDGIVLVVESGSTSRKLLEDARGRFESAGTEPLGLVLNKMDLRTSGYGQYAKAYEIYYKSSARKKPATTAADDATSPGTKSGGGAA